MAAFPLLLIDFPPKQVTKKLAFRTLKNNLDQLMF